MPARAGAASFASPIAYALPLSHVASCALEPHPLPMKKSMPTARFPDTASGHWFQTSFGNDGWSSRRIAPLPVET